MFKHEKLQDSFQSGCNILYSYSKVQKLWISPSTHKAFAVVNLFNFSHCGGCVVVSHYNFNLYFPDD